MDYWKLSEMAFFFPPNILVGVAKL